MLAKYRLHILCLALCWVFTLAEADDEESASNNNTNTGTSSVGNNTLAVVPQTMVSAQNLSVAEDINPDPDIIEINLEAKEAFVEVVPGIPTKAYTYNGVVPGPLIKGHVGAKLIVHFKNSLPEPTTIHWHGLRLPADMDGSSIAQNPIQPGETFDYIFELPDASLFWYHPHVRSNVQVEKGLAGPFLVSADKDDENIDEDFIKDLMKVRQEVLVLDDILIDENGRVTEEFSGSVREVLLKKINGREGNVLLVNGKQHPFLNVKAGEPIRLRLLNVANTRFMKVRVPGHTLTRIGGDGGFLQKPLENLPYIFIVPGERADVLLTPQGAVGSEITVYWEDVARGRHSIDVRNGKVMMGDDENDGQYGPIPLMKLVLQEGSGDENHIHLPDSIKDINRIRTGSSTTETTLMFGHKMPMANGMVHYTVNGLTYAEIDTEYAPDVKVGETQIWNLVNMTGGDHPFHLHGFFFQHLETIEKDANGNVINRQRASLLEDKDVINIPRRPAAKGSTTTVRIAVKFEPPPNLRDEDIVAFGGKSVITNAKPDAGIKGVSGGWQFHCHILEHADGGMMSYVEVRK